MSKDDLGNRMKSYESLSKTKAMNGLPVIIRLDGKGFSKFTKRFARPFCTNMKMLMVEVSKKLAKEASAHLAYTQSDEITLVLFNENPKGQLYFNGEFDKLNSVLASLASSVFVKELIKLDPEFLNENTQVAFDCRSFCVPSKVEAANAVYWRYIDCMKNSVTQVAQEHFSHKELLGVSTSDRIAMLESILNPWQDFDHEYKEGSFILKSNGYSVVKGGVYFNKMSIEEKVDFVFGVSKEYEGL